MLLSAARLLCELAASEGTTPDRLDLADGVDNGGADGGRNDHATLPTPLADALPGDTESSGSGGSRRIAIDVLLGEHLVVLVERELAPALDETHPIQLVTAERRKLSLTVQRIPLGLRTPRAALRAEQIVQHRRGERQGVVGLRVELIVILVLLVLVILVIIILVALGHILLPDDILELTHLVAAAGAGGVLRLGVEPARDTPEVERVAAGEGRVTRLGVHGRETDRAVSHFCVYVCWVLGKWIPAPHPV